MTPAIQQSITAGDGWELREEWRAIPLPGLELYEASSLGRIPHGTMLRGERHPAAKLTEGDVHAIRASADSVSSLSRRFGVSRRSVRFIRLRKTWTHVA